MTALCGFRRSLVFVAFAAIVAGCSGGSQSSAPFFTGVTMTPSPTPTPLPQHLYVGNDTSAAQIFQYNVPISAGSTSDFTLTAGNSVVAVALDGSGNLAVGELTAKLQIFPAPLSGASTASATFNNGASGSTGAVAFTNAGDLFATGLDAGGVKLFTHPFSNASTPSQTITNAGLTAADGLALDAAQNLYVGNATATSNLFVYAPPYTGAPIITAPAAGSGYRKMAVSATQLFVAVIEPTPSLGRVDVFTLPITAASVPAFTMRTSMNFPEAVALDAAGNLYVGNLGNNAIQVYAPPFSAASAPALTLPVPGFVLLGIAVGT
jgi:hypothetical protein